MQMVYSRCDYIKEDKDLRVLNSNNMTREFMDPESFRASMIRCAEMLTSRTPDMVRVIRFLDEPVRIYIAGHIIPEGLTKDLVMRALESATPQYELKGES